MPHLPDERPGPRPEGRFLVCRRALIWAFVVWAVAVPAGAAFDEATPPWVDGTPLLAERFPASSWARVPSAPAVPGPPRFQIGDRRAFFAFDFRTNRQYSVPATLRAIGDFCYLFVEDDQWGRRVNENTLAAIMRAFDRDVPGDPRRGIYEIEVDAFGDPPDIDGDGRILLLLLDIPDNFTPPNGSFVAGYFTSVNERRGIVRDPRYGIAFQSNETEMLYIDTDPLEPASKSAMGIVTHEFQHLIQFAYDPAEEVWVNEGLSEFAMFLAGYAPVPHVRAFESDPGVSLTRWPSGVASSLPYYGAAYLWMLYLYEQGGGLDTMRAIVQNPSRGIDGIESALRAGGHTESFEAIFDDWRTAVAADDPRFEDGRFGFRNARVAVNGERHRQFPVQRQLRERPDWSGDILEFLADGAASLPLQVDLTVPDRWREAFSVRALLFRGDALIGVEPVTRNPLRGQFVRSFEAFGKEATRIELSVAFRSRTSGAVTASYEYTARLGAPVSFEVFAFRHPVQRGYIEFVVVPDAPVNAGTVSIRVSGPDGARYEGDLITADGGRSFGRAFHVPAGNASTSDPSSDEWTWELRHFGAVVGTGTVRPESSN